MLNYKKVYGIEFEDGYKTIVERGLLIDGEFTKTHSKDMKLEFLDGLNYYKCRCSKCNLTYLLSFDEIYQHRIMHYNLENVKD